MHPNASCFFIEDPTFCSHLPGGPRFHLFGPNVEYANRMESTGLPGKVQISHYGPHSVLPFLHVFWITPLLWKYLRGGQLIQHISKLCKPFWLGAKLVFFCDSLKRSLLFMKTIWTTSKLFSSSPLHFFEWCSSMIICDRHLNPIFRYIIYTYYTTYIFWLCWTLCIKRHFDTCSWKLLEVDLGVLTIGFVGVDRHSYMPIHAVTCQNHLKWFWKQFDVVGKVSPCIWQGWSCWNALVVVSLTFDMVFAMMEWFCAPRLRYEAMAGHRRSRLHFWRPFSSLTDLTANRRNICLNEFMT